MKLSTKLITGFAGVLAVSTFVGVFAVVQIQRSVHIAEHQSTVEMPTVGRGQGQYIVDPAASPSFVEPFLGGHAMSLRKAA